MPGDSIYTTEQPNPADQFNGAGRMLGLAFTSSTARTITHIRFWAVTSPQPASVVVGLWQGTSWLATGAANGPFTPGWVPVELSSPVGIDPLTLYGAAWWKSSGEIAANGTLPPGSLTGSTFTGAAHLFRNTGTPMPGALPPVTDTGDFAFFADVVAEPDGDDPSTGDSAFGLGVDLAATGARPAQGLAHLQLGVDLAATGARPAQGLAHLQLGVDLAATGVPVAPPVTPPSRTLLVPAERRELLIATEERVAYVR